MGVDEVAEKHQNVERQAFPHLAVHVALKTAVKDQANKGGQDDNTAHEEQAHGFQLLGLKVVWLYTVGSVFLEGCH